jgi:hypothetical protein
MSIVTGFLRGIWYFFVEDGAIVVGTVVALILIGGLAILRPFGNASEIVGPLLFLLIAALLLINLLWVARQARSRSGRGSS